jgi:hypothetical protein
VNLHDILLKHAKDQKLAHFYIVEGRGALAFAHNFIRDYYQKIEGHKQSLNNLMDHPDVYVLGNLPETEKPEYKDFNVEEAGKLSRFFEFKPVQSKRKFAVITEGDRVNKTVANKWLKLLEEPTGESTIFLLNTLEQKLLPTIHSRALHIRLPRVKEDIDSTDWNQFLTEASKMPLSQFLETYSRGNYSLDLWISEVLRWESLQTDSAKSKNALVSWIKNFEEMDTFNQPHATKWALFHSYLGQHVFPRTTR